MSNLLRQLNELKQNKATIPLKERASVLFDGKQAAGIDRETILSLALKAFQHLSIQEPKLKDFESLFSYGTKDNDRMHLVLVINS